LGEIDEIYECIIIGGESSCRQGDENLAVIHACKSPCHQRVLNYRGSLPKDHPNYLVLEEDKDLYLNIIDPPIPLFKLPLFTTFVRFADKHWNESRKLLIHCNLGESRAPSLALLFLAKCKNHISNDSFESAKEEFIELYPGYNPGRGIQIYLSEHWDELNNYC